MPADPEPCQKCDVNAAGDGRILCPGCETRIGGQTVADWYGRA